MDRRERLRVGRLVPTPAGLPRRRDHVDRQIPPPGHRPAHPPRHVAGHAGRGRGPHVRDEPARRGREHAHRHIRAQRSGRPAHVRQAARPRRRGQEGRRVLPGHRRPHARLQGRRHQRGRSVRLLQAPDRGRQGPRHAIDLHAVRRQRQAPARHRRAGKDAGPDVRNGKRADGPHVPVARGLHRRGLARRRHRSRPRRPRAEGRKAPAPRPPRPRDA